MFPYLFSDILSYLLGDDLIGDIYKEQGYVSYIYDMLFLVLLLMNYIFMYFIFSDNKNKVFKNNYLITEFCINFPITLGVMGTLISISDAMLNSKVDLSNIISGNFGAAILTTIIGGAIYGYCFILQAVMSRYVD